MAGANEPLPSYYCGGGNPKKHFFDPTTFEGDVPEAYDFREEYEFPQCGN